MNVKRFVGRNARQAMALARAALGEQAVVLSNRPCAQGVEILAMAGADVPPTEAGDEPTTAAAPEMSTLSFQQFVRERRRQDERTRAQPREAEAPRAPEEPGRFAREAIAFERASREEPVVAASAQAPRELLAELKAMRGMISAQLATLSWFDGVRRDPVQTRILRLLMANGFSASLARQLVERIPMHASQPQAERWLLDALAHNVRCAGDDSIVSRGGVWALVGPTGVGKTTCTAKIAAAFALKHGPGSVGLITVDTYRLAASDQLRAFGRILGIPVHTARDTASLGELLDLFVGKKLVLIDTVGVGQRDQRVAEVMSALAAPRISRLVVLNASAQAETLDEVARVYAAEPGTRCILSKIDEAATCGGVVDVVLRRRLLVEGVANGQRVPEDWHSPSSRLIAQKALMCAIASRYSPGEAELGALLTMPPAGAPGAAHA